jgi:antitoxin HicB
MLAYTITLEPDDNGTLLVTCPDLPGVITFGTDRADAVRHAQDAIEEWLAGVIDDGLAIPLPKRKASGPDQAIATTSALTTLKVELYRALRAAAITRAELGRRLGWKRESVDRLFRLDHRSRLEQLEAAFRALGREIDVVVRKAA